MSGNLLANIPAALPEELVEVLAKGDGVRIERIVSKGHTSSEGFWYDQDENEFVLLLQGEAGIEFESGSKQLKSGDWLLIPAHQKHRVIRTSREPVAVWLAVFF